MQVQLLSSFEGTQVYPEPKEIPKAEVFATATAEHQVKADWGRIPDGEYYCLHNDKGHGKVSATMCVEDGTFIVKKGSMCLPAKEGWVPVARKNAPIKDNILQDDVSTNSPSTAGWIVLGHATNGWVLWKDQSGNPIDIYRKNK